MKCIIVDDEPIARRGLKRLLEKYNNIELMQVFGSAKDALFYLSVNEVDLVFLDIQMDDLNGIEIARIIKDKTLVIFTTAYSQYAVESYDVNAIDYLMKPINRDRLHSAIEKAEKYLNMINFVGVHPNEIQSGQDCLIVRSERKYLRLQIQDIKYIEGLKDYVIIHLTDSKVITRLTLKAILGILPESVFLRISKTYAVNRLRIKSFDNNDVSLDGETLSIGAAYRDAVLANLLS